MDVITLFDRLSKKNNRPLISKFSKKGLKKFVREKLQERESYYLKAKYTIEVNKLNLKSLSRKIHALSRPI